MPRKAKSKDAVSPSDAETGEKPIERTKPKARRRRVNRHRHAAAHSSTPGRPKRARKSGRPGRVRYSDAERQKILETAKREGLTGAQVRDRFGVSTLSFYMWRKKSGAKRRRPKGRTLAAGEAVGRTVGQAMNVADAIRDELRSYIRRILPGLLASELGGEETGRGRKGRRQGN